MVWDKLASKYDDLWLQKYSLTPTRHKIHNLIDNIIQTQDYASREEYIDTICILDIGCGTGQLVLELYEKYTNLNLPIFILGIDKSEEMLNIARTKTNSENIVFTNFHMGKDGIDTLLNLLPDNCVKFDIICCCHSFPYYEDKHRVLIDIQAMLSTYGTALFFQASINSIYDRFALAIIELTAEKADYLSKKDFIKISNEYLQVNNTFIIKEIFYAPTICGFQLTQKD